MEGVL